MSADPTQLELERASALMHAELADNNGAISDDELARNFSNRNPDFRYVAPFNKWFVFTGMRYAPDDTMLTFDAARQSVRLDLGYAIKQTNEDSRKRALRSRLGSASVVAAIVKLAAADRRHALAPDQLDSNPWVLNTPSGVVDLRTAQIRPHDPSEYHTKITTATPIAPTEAPTFEQVLKRVLPDPEVREYFQRLVGYFLTGVVREHILVLVYGPGGNGKSLVFNAIREALGDYAITLGSEVLMESHNDRHPTEIAVLRGARMALCSEVDSGRRWNEARIKRLTGGDPITARYMRGDSFEFEPSHKLVLLANAKPGLRVVDEAIRRRIHLLEFPVTIPDGERDADLPEKLRAEAGGILGWAIHGCLDWLDMGLKPPKSVLEATDQYLSSEDSIAQWISECCRPLGSSTLTTLHASYREWATANSIPVVGRNTFGDQLEARGIQRTEVRPRVWNFVGISPLNRAEIRNAS